MTEREGDEEIERVERVDAKTQKRKREEVRESLKAGLNHL
jgi:hypothetical protein